MPGATPPDNDTHLSISLEGCTPAKMAAGAAVTQPRSGIARLSSLEGCTVSNRGQRPRTARHTLSISLEGCTPAKMLNH